jgi:hypothetical protein
VWCIEEVERGSGAGVARQGRLFVAKEVGDHLGAGRRSLTGARGGFVVLALLRRVLPAQEVRQFVAQPTNTRVVTTRSVVRNLQVRLRQLCRLDDSSVG